MHLGSAPLSSPSPVQPNIQGVHRAQGVQRDGRVQEVPKSAGVQRVQTAQEILTKPMNSMKDRRFHAHHDSQISQALRKHKGPLPSKESQCSWGSNGCMEPNRSDHSLGPKTSSRSKWSKVAKQCKVSNNPRAPTGSKVLQGGQ